MSRWREAIARLPAKRLVWLAMWLAPLVFLALLGIFWIYDHIASWAFWKAGLIFLIAAEVVYGLTLALLIPGTLVFAFLVCWRRRRQAAGQLVPALVVAVRVAFGCDRHGRGPLRGTA